MQQRKEVTVEQASAHLTIFVMFVALRKSHCEISTLKLDAPNKANEKSRTDDVFHAEISELNMSAARRRRMSRIIMMRAPWIAFTERDQLTVHELQQSGGKRRRLVSFGCIPPRQHIVQCFVPFQTYLLRSQDSSRIGHY
jgi:hypothetical protein